MTYERKVVTWRDVEPICDRLAMERHVEMRHFQVVEDAIKEVIEGFDHKSYRLVAYGENSFMLVFEREEVQHPSYP